MTDHNGVVLPLNHLCEHMQVCFAVLMSAIRTAARGVLFKHTFDDIIRHHQAMFQVLQLIQNVDGAIDMTAAEIRAWAKRMLKQIKETDAVYVAMKEADERIAAAEKSLRKTGAIEAKIEKDIAEEEEAEWIVIQIDASQETEGGNAAGVTGMAAPVMCTPADQQEAVSSGSPPYLTRQQARTRRAAQHGGV
jgi:hypothetical protein